MRIAGWIAVMAMVVFARPTAAESLYGLESRGPQRGEVGIEVVRSIELHSYREDITSICRADWNVKGCTDFPVEILECRCERRGDEWVINSVAKITAITHLENAARYGSVLAHEQRHMTDVEAGLRVHLENLASRQFDTEQGCRRFAKFLSGPAHLRAVMNKLRVESNAKFGCSRESAR